MKQILTQEELNLLKSINVDLPGDRELTDAEHIKLTDALMNASIYHLGIDYEPTELSKAYRALYNKLGDFDD